MQPVTVQDAAKRLPELVQLVQAGTEVVILSGNAPAAKLVPAVRPGYGDLQGQVVMADDFDAPLDAFADYMP
jgi:antitoxin (DNA-binding transcriptional repressor) of toxin-antitoxin stability system